jgi:hypothetical protein
MSSSRQALQEKVKIFRQKSKDQRERDLLDQLAEVLKGKTGDVVSQVRLQKMEAGFALRPILRAGG